MRLPETLSVIEKPEESNTSPVTGEFATDEPHFADEEEEDLPKIAPPIDGIVKRSIDGYCILLKQFVPEDEIESEISNFKYYLETDPACMDLSVHPHLDTFMWRTARRDSTTITLCTIASRILVCPPSEAQSERTNGAQKKILNALRTRTNLDLLEARLMLIQNPI
jgi:hypothetical protein